MFPKDAGLRGIPNVIFIFLCTPRWRSEVGQTVHLMLFDNPAAWLFAAIVAPCAFLAIKYWQSALFGVFVLLVFEGALRKWAFPWAQAQIYLVKDAILLVAYLGFILDTQRNPSAQGIGLIKTVLVA